MINGINSGVSGMSWYNMSQMNNFKLSLLSNKYTGVSSNKGGGMKLGAGDINFLGDYQKSMSDLMSAANTLSGTNKSGVFNSMGIASSDNKVMSATTRYSVNAKESYTVDVKQLASAQKNTSTQLGSYAKPTESGSFTIATGSKTVRFDVDPTGAKNNKEMLSELAKEINRNDLGVTAKIVEEGGKVSLAITGQKTGAENGFTVTGGFAANMGLDTVTDTAKDAVYTVEKSGGSGPVEYTDSDNTVSIGGYKIEAKLKQTGTATLSAGVDTGKTADAMEKLVKSFNSTLSMLDANSARSATATRQLRNMILPPTSEKTMAKVGITIGKDGSMSFDRKVFDQAMEKDPALVKDIIGGSNGIAQGIIKDTQKALQVTSANLLGQNGSNLSGASLGGYQGQQQMFDTNQLSMMSAYSKSGAYNMTNYYTVGAMMNLFI